MDTILINGYTGKVGHIIAKHLSCEIIGCNRRYPLSDGIKQSPDLIIDVTSANAIHTFINQYLSAKIPTIIGTSGIKPSDAEKICQQADFPLIIAPNFAPGLKSLIQQAISLSRNAQIHIRETHHNSKIDTPSGTSLFLAHYLNTNKIISRRITHYTAKHEIIISYPNHNITLTHHIKKREAFLDGVCLAIQTIKHINNGQVLFF